MLLLCRGYHFVKDAVKIRAAAEISLPRFRHNPYDLPTTCLYLRQQLL
jgi:hypothetical protein